MGALSPKKLSVLLFVSIALNLFLGGLFVGSDMRHWLGRYPYFAADGYRHDGGHRKMSRDGPHGLMGMHRVLGPEGRKAAQEVMASHHKEMRPRFRAMGEARRQVKDALLADPFDPRALRAALATLRARGVETQAAIHSAMAALAERLSAADRRRMAEHMPGALGRHGHRGPDAPRPAADAGPRE